MTKKKFSWIFAVFALCCMTAIFYFSSQDYYNTNSFSKQFVNSILSHTFQNFDSLDANTKVWLTNSFNLFVRKCAHFSLYSIMSFLTYIFIYLRNSKYIKTFILSVAFGGIFAVLDEIHQMFVPGRTPLIKDVVIDTSGCIFGAFLCFLIISAVITVWSQIKNKSVEK